MASIIYCDRARHIVEEPRTQINDLLADGEHRFIYVTPVNTNGSQVALRASAITSFQAVPGDGI